MGVTDSFLALRRFTFPTSLKFIIANSPDNAPVRRPAGLACRRSNRRFRYPRPKRLHSPTALQNLASASVAYHSAMGLFGKNKAEKQEDFDAERAKEVADFAARTIEFPEIEVKSEIWWEGGWYEKGSRNNDTNHETNIHVVLNKSKNTQKKDRMERSTQEIGYLIPKSLTEVDVMVFGKIVNKLKPNSAKKILQIIDSPTPVKVGLGHCYANEDHKLPERYATWIDLRLKNTPRKKAPSEKIAKKKEKPVDQMAEKVKAFGANQEVVGLSYNAATLEPIVGNTTEGSVVLRVVLKRNPNNQYDENAVEVRVNGDIAGHIPRTDNLKYHSMLDLHEKIGKAYECDAIVCWATKGAFKDVRLDLKADPNAIPPTQ